VAHEAALAELGARLGAAEARAGELQARLEAAAAERAAAAATAAAEADAQRERVAELEAALGAPLCPLKFVPNSAHQRSLGSKQRCLHRQARKHAAARAVQYTSTQ